MHHIIWDGKLQIMYYNNVGRVIFIQKSFFFLNIDNIFAPLVFRKKEMSQINFTQSYLIERD